MWFINHYQTIPFFYKLHQTYGLFSNKVTVLDIYIKWKLYIHGCSRPSWFVNFPLSDSWKTPILYWSLIVKLSELENLKILRGQQTC